MNIPSPRRRKSCAISQVWRHSRSSLTRRTPSSKTVALQEIQMTEQCDILFDVRDGIARVTFNRPQARNAFTFQMYERVAEICQQANRDRSIKVLIFTGAGD